MPIDFANQTINAYTKNATPLGTKPTFSLVKTGLLASIQPIKGYLRLLYASRQIEISHHIYVSANLGLNTNGLITVGTRNFVVASIRNLGEANQCWQYACNEVYGLELIIEDAAE